ncbi:MAG: NAD(P)H-hydrate dehydratase [Oscillospiraceae bacterium]|jgi:NAD(P)H-hydrate epimerase|nr:NAD(P)H-hydrate dehydratase [Oscillospiraceae bacterium]
MQKIFTLTFEEVLARLPGRDESGHKGSFGHVLSVCGSLRYPGAAVLAALGAVHLGAGLVTAAFPLHAYPAIAPQLTVAPLLPLTGNRQGTLHVSALPQLREAMKGKSALLAGCGLGLNAHTREITAALLRETKCPLVLDADGLNALETDLRCLRPEQRQNGGNLVLTPHPGEMARMTGCSVKELEAAREKMIPQFAALYKIVLVYKGANTLVASPEGALYRNETGNSGLAKGGSGDLLAGMLASLLAQGMPGFDAALCAVYLHGLAADRAATRLSKRGMTALDCLEELKRMPL